MFLKIETIGLLVVLSLVILNLGYSGEFLLYDGKHSFEESGNVVQYLNIEPDVFNIWISSDDYYHGLLYIRYAVLNINTQQSINLVSRILPFESDSLMIESDRKICEGPGIYFHVSSPSEWWMKDGMPIEYSKFKSFEKFGVSLQIDEDEVFLSGIEQLWTESFYPIKIRVTIVAISQGAVFSGWHNYINDTDGPNIWVWHGLSQKIGHLGDAQDDFNLLGNVSDDSGVSNLTYELNGNPAVTLSIGDRSDGFGDGRRLAATGDFNADILINNLNFGNNTVLLTAIDDLGNISNVTVTINCQTSNSILPVNIDWSSINNPQDVGQYIDGLWGKEGSGIRVLRTGYDRIFLIGERTWQDYEVIVPITIYDILPLGPLSGVAQGVGILMRFTGHYIGTYRNWPVAQPKWGYQPFGGIGWLSWENGNSVKRFYRGDWDLWEDFGNFPVTQGNTYWMKMRCETLPDEPNGDGVTKYFWKIWEDGSAEPQDWDFVYTQISEYALRQGGVGLIAHHVDATFGDVIVRDLAYPQISNIEISTTQTGATISWDTNEPATSRVDYGLTSSYGNFEEDLSLKTNHVFIISGLTPNTFYNFKITSVDASNNSTSSSNLIFHTKDDAPTTIVTDYFDGPTLNTSLWKFVDPVGDASYNMAGSQIEISVPVGVDHDPWIVNTSARIMQSANDTDFEVDAKFDSDMIETIQGQGILIQESPDRYLRFDMFYHTSSVRVYSALLDNGLVTEYINQEIQAIAPMKLRVHRVGDNWSYLYASNGQNWITAVTYEKYLVVDSVGVFSANFGIEGAPAPAHSAIIDHFGNGTDIPLPVELSGFWANQVDNHVVISWSTESEINNAGFEIFRSEEELSQYHLISTYENNPELQGKGNSSEKNIYSYLDYQVVNGRTYWYKIADVDYSGNRTYHGPIYITLNNPGLTSRGPHIPEKFDLHPNFPNPFNPSTTLQFDIPYNDKGLTKIDLVIYNNLGQIVRQLYRDNLGAGIFRIRWDGKDDAGNFLPTGLYFAEFRSQQFSKTIRMTLLK